ncbi:Ribokinase-like protein [Polyplosphaeria fusca]|uniref:Ribokinase n=1 Tax=Polyplosphaeria fusca TaxID=682080 RepID=A0A9P4QQK3_9PLEO|nr:Ribokinase-like protein [Polyplosphaeria fusca]
MPPKPAVISVIGSLNVDLVTRTPRIPVAGETLTSDSFTMGFGGKGANQAVACARLSRTKAQATTSLSAACGGDVEVRMVGALGDDAFAGGFLESLKKDGVRVEGVRVLEGRQSGTATILVESGSGQNRILFCPGANYEVGDGDLVGEEVDVVLFQLELPVDVVLRNMRTARDKGVETIINPAPAIPLPEEAYKGLGHLIVNETEASILSGIENPTDWNEVAAIFFKRGVNNVIITLGGDGVFYHTAQRHSESQPGKVVLANKVPVVDTTAAGDTFVGAYTVAVARSKAGLDTEFDLDAVVAYANRAASLTVQRAGAQSSIPWVDEVPA